MLSLSGLAPADPASSDVLFKPVFFWVATEVLAGLCLAPIERSANRRYTDDALGGAHHAAAAHFRFPPRGVVVVVFFDAAYGVRGDFNDDLGWCARSLRLRELVAANFHLEVLQRRMRRPVRSFLKGALAHRPPARDAAPAPPPPRRRRRRAAARATRARRGGRREQAAAKRPGRRVRAAAHAAGGAQARHERWPCGYGPSVGGLLEQRAGWMRA